MAPPFFYGWRGARIFRMDSCRESAPSPGIPSLSSCGHLNRGCERQGVDVHIRWSAAGRLQFGMRAGSVWHGRIAHVPGLTGVPPVDRAERRTIRAGRPYCRTLYTTWASRHTFIQKSRHVALNLGGTPILVYIRHTWARRPCHSKPTGGTPMPLTSSPTSPSGTPPPIHDGNAFFHRAKATAFSSGFPGAAPAWRSASSRASPPEFPEASSPTPS